MLRFIVLENVFRSKFLVFNILKNDIINSEVGACILNIWFIIDSKVSV